MEPTCCFHKFFTEVQGLSLLTCQRNSLAPPPDRTQLRALDWPIIGFDFLLIKSSLDWATCLTSHEDSESEDDSVESTQTASSFKGPRTTRLNPHRLQHRPRNIAMSAWPPGNWLSLYTRSQVTVCCLQTKFESRLFKSNWLSSLPREEEEAKPFPPAYLRQKKTFHHLTELVPRTDWCFFQVQLDSKTASKHTQPQSIPSAAPSCHAWPQHIVKIKDQKLNAIQLTATVAAFEHAKLKLSQLAVFEHTKLKLSQLAVSEHAKPKLSQLAFLSTRSWNFLSWRLLKPCNSRNPLFAIRQVVNY